MAARDEYLHARNAARRLAGGDYTDRADDLAHDQALAKRLEEPLFAEMLAAEEFILTVTTDGYGKRSSAYEFPHLGAWRQGNHRDGPASSGW